jgi:hypothetical protein
MVAISLPSLTLGHNIAVPNSKTQTPEFFKLRKWKRDIEEEFGERRSAAAAAAI